MWSTAYFSIDALGQEQFPYNFRRLKMEFVNIGINIFFMRLFGIYGIFEFSSTVSQQSVNLKIFIYVK